MKTAETKRKPRRTVEVLNAGANRGARTNLGTFQHWNQESQAIVLAPRYVDPVLGRAEMMKSEAKMRGLDASAVEGTIEQVIAAEGAKNKPLLLNLDRADAIARAVLATDDISCPVLGYLLLKLPSGEMWGVRFFLAPGDLEARRLAVKLFHRLGEVAARRGSGAILGVNGTVADRAAEPLYRRWFAEHTRENLGKLFAGLEPAGNTFEVTDDGQTTYALIIEERDTWAAPDELAAAIARNPPIPILRGESWVIAEVTGAGVRFHKVRRRQTDDRVCLQGLSAMDEASVDRERAARESAAALVRAERQTLSRSRPVLSTD